MRSILTSPIAGLCAILLCAPAALAQSRPESPPDARQAVVIEVETHRGELLMPPVFLEYGENRRPQMEFVNRDSKNAALLIPMDSAGEKGATVFFNFYSFFPGSAFLKLGAPKPSSAGLELSFAYELTARMISDYQPGAEPDFSPVRAARLDRHRSALIDKNGDMVIGMEGAWRSPGHPGFSPQPALVPLDGSRALIGQEGGLLIYARHFQKKSATPPALSE